MFDPLAYPYVRAQTFVDPNPPAVLSQEFFNPTQDAIARLYGGLSGYSTSISNEEFVLPQATVTPDPFGPTDIMFGQELVVGSNPSLGFKFSSVTATSAGMHGVYRVSGNAAGDRGAGAAGFVVSDNQRNVGLLRWIFRARVRCSAFATIDNSPPGLVFGLGAINAAAPRPSWIADSTGFWTTFWDSGATVTAIPTVDDEWVTLFIAHRDGDGVVRWYLKRDADPLPLLLDTQTPADTDMADIKRYSRILVTGAAAAADYVEYDNISLLCER